MSTVTGRELLNIDARNEKAVTLSNPYQADSVSRLPCPPLGRQDQFERLSPSGNSDSSKR